MAETELFYGTNPGCVRRVSVGAGTPGQCGGVEAAAVPHRYQYPRPHNTRLYVCAWHSRDEPTAESLTDQDRRTIAERYARRSAQLARVTVGPYARTAPVRSDGPSRPS